MAAYEDVKGEGTTTLERTETGYSSADEKHGLEQQQTLSEVDLENKAAYKGDNSDGAVDWTVRNILASIFLCTLYTGRF